MIKGFIFDSDGVVVNTEKLQYRSFQAAVAEYGIALDYEGYQDVFGQPREEVIKSIFKKYRNTVVAPKDLDYLCRKKNEHFLAFLDQEGVAVIDDTIAFIKELRAKKLLTAIASASKNVQDIARRAGLEKLFDCVVSGFDFTRGKPHPDVFLVAAERLGLSPQACVVVEDSPAGIQAGKAAGMITIALTTNCGRDYLRAADYIVASLRELDQSLFADRKDQL